MDKRTKKLLGSATVAVASFGLRRCLGFGAPSTRSHPSEPAAREPAAIWWLS
jgi:hypothetical protein